MFPLCCVDTTTGVCSQGSGSVAARKPPYSCLRSHQRNENQLFRLARHRAGRAHVAEHSTALAPDKAESSSPSPELRFHGTSRCPLLAHGKRTKSWPSPEPQLQGHTQGPQFQPSPIPVPTPVPIPAPRATVLDFLQKKTTGWDRGTH